MVNIAGHKINNWYLVGGVAGVFIVFYIYKKSSSTTTGTSSTTSTGTDPVTGLPYSEDNQVDPATGMTYLQEAQEYGSVTAAESATTGGYGSYYGASGYGGYYGTAGYPASGVNTGYSYGSNAQWAQAVTAGLTSLGYSSTDISAALGLYFQNLPLSANYASIVQAAIAEYGPPPVGLYSILTSPAGGTAAEVTVPDVITEDLVNAQQALSQEGLKSTFTGPAWHTGEVRTITAQDPNAGSKVSAGSTVKLTYTIAGQSSSQVTVPNVIGEAQENAISKIAATGLHATGTPSVKGKTLIVVSQSPNAGSKANRGSTVTLQSKVV
jgi:hypothetical protein